MIFNPAFRKTILVSLLGHFAVFSIFSLSFSNRIPKINYAVVSFWGQFLDRSDLIPRLNLKQRLISKTYTLPENKLNTPLNFGELPLKPPIILSFIQEKINFIPNTTSLPYSRPKDSSLIFHPLLPYYFILYFKDRQVAHLELMFKIITSNRTNSIVIKRKISSGNLEVDLLSMRYIGHYLFLQQGRFLPERWQTVKIDFSTQQ